MSTPDSKTRKFVVGAAVLFCGLATAIVVLAARTMVTVQMAVLMLVALLGLYFGFGVLIAVHRLVGKLK